MAYEFKLPDLGEGLTEGEIGRWLVAEGEEIAEDAPLVEIQTDKTTVEIPSPAAGRVAQILVAEGEVVPVGTVLVVIGADGGSSDGAEPDDGNSTADQPRAEPAAQQDAAAAVADMSRGQAPGPVSPGRVRATPLVRRLAQELGVDLSSIQPTGAQGRVTESDVRAAASAGADVSQGQVPGPGPEGRRQPLRGVRRLIAEHMARAHREAAPVTWVEECDFGRVPLDRLVPTVLKACALALREYPELNARLEGDEIVFIDRYDLGVAVQTEEGLVVPVVRGCATRPLDELAADVARLAESARAGMLRPEELRGSTFTVTSAGKLAGLFQTPIVNHPEVAILSVGRIAERPVVRDGELAIGTIGYVALTFDHRVVDGARAAAFGLDVVRRLEAGDPSGDL
jgi:pyruvate dehydrogenase E2 component (dihydrolipoamide acetyltransferase)